MKLLVESSLMFHLQLGAGLKFGLHGLTCVFLCLQMFLQKGQEDSPLFSTHSILVTRVPAERMAPQ